MNVLLHCIYFPPEVGGLESHVYHLGRGLARRGHGVTVVTSISQPGLAREETVDGMRIIRTPLRGRNAIGWAGHALGSTPATVRAARQADILHAQAFGSVLPCMLARRRTDRPVIATFHTSHFLTRAERGIWRPILSGFVRTADRCLAASQEIADVAEGLAPGSRVEALTNGVDTEMFQPVAPTFEEGRHRRLIIPRRLFAKNGVEYLVRAMPHLLARLPGEEIEAMIVGDGPEGPRLRALAEELGVAGSIRFMGARPNTEMPGLLASSAIAVLPSLMEATSVAALEAMACGVPVAASNVGGLPEIIDGEVGALFPAANPAALAETVAGLLVRDDLPALGEAARRRVVEQWSVDRLVERHLEIYQEMLVANGSGGRETARREGGGS